MDPSPPLELLAVLVCYLLAFVFVIGPAVESVTGFETLSAPGFPGSFERTWELVSKPQGWLLCLGYVLTHFTVCVVIDGKDGRFNLTRVHL